MTSTFSLYLDLVRFVAAALVLLYHSNLRSITTHGAPLSDHGHEAVIVFFVLSGYVISYVYEHKERTALEYWSSRLARFYSVALPAVLLTPLLDLWGQALVPAFYTGMTTNDYGWLRMLTSLAFLNEAWTLSIMSFSNVPYWSLCYEMWYYILFSIVVFARGRMRAAMVGAAALLIGPKVLLLAPIWLLGVVLHRYDAWYRLPQWMGWFLFLSCWPLYVAFRHYGVDAHVGELLQQWVGSHWRSQLTFSKYFLTDYLLAIIVAMNFVGMRTIAPGLQVPLAAQRVIRWLAGYTLSLYIFHQPLLLFYAALFNGDPGGRLFYVQVTGATVLSIIVLGAVTEQKRHHLRSLIKTWLQRLAAARWRRWAVVVPSSRERI